MRICTYEITKNYIKIRIQKTQKCNNKQKHPKNNNTHINKNIHKTKKTKNTKFEKSSNKQTINKNTKIKQYTKNKNHQITKITQISKT